MTGHRQILALRAAGQKPAHVVVLDFEPLAQRRRFEPHPERAIESGEPATVYLPSIDGCDLRWAHGLNITLAMPDASEARFNAYWQAFQAVKPRMLTGVSATGELELWRPA
jgi:hypothetical protein